jgi:hypothetical protein
VVRGGAPRLARLACPIRSFTRSLVTASSRPLSRMWSCILLAYVYMENGKITVEDTSAEAEGRRQRQQILREQIQVLRQQFAATYACGRDTPRQSTGIGSETPHRNRVGCFEHSSA